MESVIGSKDRDQSQRQINSGDLMQVLSLFKPVEPAIKSKAS